LIGAFGIFAVQTTAGFAAEMSDPAAIVKALTHGGYVIYLRHAATDLASRKAAEIDLNDCATQRNLSDKGRADARRIGAALAASKIKVSEVRSSPFCRCIETAKLAFGRATVNTDLAFTIGEKRSEAAKKTAALRRMLGERPAPGTNAVIVSHTSNLKEAADVWPKPEGVMEVFRPTGDGGFEHVGKIAPDAWHALTGGS
jgi:broad specificity phosphatase PhoE